MRNKLVRLMTHIDTDVKHCAAEFLFVLCKESGMFVIIASLVTSHLHYDWIQLVTELHNKSHFCHVSVSRFIKYTGYGNAAGLLAARGLMRGGRDPGHYSEDEDSDTEEYREAKPQYVTTDITKPKACRNSGFIDFKNE